MILRWLYHNIVYYSSSNISDDCCKFELSRVGADEMIPTQFICVPARIYPSQKTGRFWAALQLPCTALQKTDRQPKGWKRRFPWKWGMDIKNQAKMKEKEPKIVDFGLNVAEGVGFEPTWAWAQTVFKTFRMLPESSRIIPEPPRFSARFSLFLAPSRKFARNLREACEKPLKNT